MESFCSSNSYHYIPFREASCSALALFASVDPDTLKDAILPSLLSLMADDSGLLLRL